MLTKDRNDESLCEKSMSMVVNIIKLSSFSIAKMSLGDSTSSTASKNLRPMKNSVTVGDEHLLPRFLGTHRSEKPRSRSKPMLVEPGAGRKSLLKVHQDNSIIDDLAFEYI